MELVSNHSGNLADELEVKYGLTVMNNFEKQPDTSFETRSGLRMLFLSHFSGQVSWNRASFGKLGTVLVRRSMCEVPVEGSRGQVPCELQQLVATRATYKVYVEKVRPVRSRMGRQYLHILCNIFCRSSG